MLREGTGALELKRRKASKKFFEDSIDSIKQTESELEDEEIADEDQSPNSDSSQGEADEGETQQLITGDADLEPGEHTERISSTMSHSSRAGSTPGSSGIRRTPATWSWNDASITSLVISYSELAVPPTITLQGSYFEVLSIARLSRR